MPVTGITCAMHCHNASAWHYGRLPCTGIMRVTIITWPRTGIMRVTGITCAMHWHNACAWHYVNHLHDVQGSSGEVLYSMGQTPPDAVPTVVSVAPDTGVVSLRRTLDWEQRFEHVVLLLATDGGLPPRTATATLTVSADTPHCHCHPNGQCPHPTLPPPPSRWVLPPRTATATLTVSAPTQHCHRHPHGQCWDLALPLSPSRSVPTPHCNRYTHGQCCHSTPGMCTKEGRRKLNRKKTMDYCDVTFGAISRKILKKICGLACESNLTLAILMPQHWNFRNVIIRNILYITYVHIP